MHPCVNAWDESEHKPTALTFVAGELSRIAQKLSIEFDPRIQASIPDGQTDLSLALYQAVQGLSESELDRLSGALVLLSFGQFSIDALDTDESLFNRIAVDLRLAMREWWMPDAEFLTLLRKDQLETVAVESGALLRMAKLKSYGKKQMVDALAQYFARTPIRRQLLLRPTRKVASGFRP